MGASSTIHLPPCRPRMPSSCSNSTPVPCQRRLVEWKRIVRSPKHCLRGSSSCRRRIEVATSEESSTNQWYLLGNAIWQKGMQIDTECNHVSLLRRTLHVWQWCVLKGQGMKRLQASEQAKRGKGAWRTYLAASISCDPSPFLLRDGTTQMARNPQTAGTASCWQIMAPGPWLSSLFLSGWLCRVKTSLLKLIFPNSNVLFACAGSILLSGNSCLSSDEELGITLCAAFIGSATRHPTILPLDTNR
jgi:hypothetical protein